MWVLHVMVCFSRRFSGYGSVTMYNIHVVYESSLKRHARICSRRRRSLFYGVRFGFVGFRSKASCVFNAMLTPVVLELIQKAICLR